MHIKIFDLIDKSSASHRGFKCKKEPDIAIFNKCDLHPHTIMIDRTYWGYLCGYVILPDDDDTKEILRELCKSPCGNYISSTPYFKGGDITFYKKLSIKTGYHESLGFDTFCLLKHSPDAPVIGIDFNHSGHHAPLVDEYKTLHSDDRYVDIEEVYAECIELSKNVEETLKSFEFQEVTKRIPIRKGNHNSNQEIGAE